MSRRDRQVVENATDESVPDLQQFLRVVNLNHGDVESDDASACRTEVLKKRRMKLKRFGGEERRGAVRTRGRMREVRVRGVWKDDASSGSWTRVRSTSTRLTPSFIRTVLLSLLPPSIDEPRQGEG